jgi:hypothetical protein
MPDDAIWTENAAIPKQEAVSLIASERVQYPAEDLIQYLLVSLQHSIQPLPRNNAVLHLDWQESEHFNAVRWGYRLELGI